MPSFLLCLWLCWDAYSHTSYSGMRFSLCSIKLSLVTIPNNHLIDYMNVIETIRKSTANRCLIKCS